MVAEDHSIEEGPPAANETPQLRRWWYTQPGKGINLSVVPRLWYRLLAGIQNILSQMHHQLIGVEKLPFAGGAFFIEITSVATAFKTNDISDSRYLQSENEHDIAGL